MSRAGRLLAAPLDRVRLGVHRRSAITRRCRLGEIMMSVEVTSPRELSPTRAYVNEEPGTLEWLQGYVRAGDVLYDVGANIGLYSIYVAKRHGGSVPVYCFEPESQNYAALNRNLYLNSVSDLVTPFCLALTDQPRIEAFNVRGQLRAGGAIHQFGSTLDDMGRPFSPIHRHGMLGVALDDLHAAYGLPFPSHIKIDVDGQEAAVIAGAARTLSDERLKSVSIEVTDIPQRADGTRAIFEAFEAAGFQVVSRASTRPTRPDHLSSNIVFARHGRDGG